MKNSIISRPKSNTKGICLLKFFKFRSNQITKGSDWYIFVSDSLVNEFRSNSNEQINQTETIENASIKVIVKY